MTVFNEASSIEAFINSLMHQTMLPSEIIIVDGGSTDLTVMLLKKYFKNTFKDKKTVVEDIKNSKEIDSKDIKINQEILFEYRIDKKIKVMVIGASGAFISQGRNIAIKNSSKELICVSDAGCILDSKWLDEITKYNRRSKSPIITGGYNYPCAENLLQATLAICMLPKKSEINHEGYMPSSRNICFNRKIWEEVGGYPENMDFGEDMKFNFNARSAGYAIKFNPDAIVYWNLRKDIYSIFRQFFRYAKGDAIGKMYTHRHIIRFTALIVVVGIIIVSILYSPWFFLLFFLLFSFYCSRPYRRVNYVLRNSRSCVFIKNRKELILARIKIILIIPFLLIIIDIAKLLGYIYGILQAGFRFK